LTVTIQNTGGAVTVTTLVRFYLSLDQTKGPGDKLLGGNIKLTSFPAGGTLTNTKQHRVKLTTAPGLYWVVVCADDKNTVVETNEGNNCRASTTRVNVTP
jgi:subtilase family serine protease